MHILSLALSSIMATASLGSRVELSGEHKETVREALIDSLNRHSLSCTWEGVNRPSDRFMPDVIKQILRNDSAIFIASEEETRPKIIVKRPSNFYDLNYIEMNFNTTFDQEKVEFIELYEARARVERRNVGTVFNPRFENVEIHDTVLSGRCDLY